ncbi:MAG: hypothetical protein WC867_05100 [Candidatus Pacearchaeota archaeon]|jgi:preprotein translocase subunit SecD
MKTSSIPMRVWILIIVLICSVIAIAPWGYFEQGVVIRGVDKNSTAFDEGMKTGMIITSINGETVNNFQDYTRVIDSTYPTGNKTGIKFVTRDAEFILFDSEPPKITVANIPKTRIKTGLDLSGGARAIVKAENKSLDSNELSDLISITSNRFNEFGIADISVRPVTDLSGNNFMLIEVAGATTSDLNNLIAEQGKFEAKVGNTTIFIGGLEDITYVARTGEQSGIYSCGAYQGEEVCSFRFTITLSEKAAKKQAATTDLLTIDSTNPEYLSEKLDLYLDDNLVDSLSISKDLKGKETTQIMIQGSGKGATRQDAYVDAQNNMKHLQTILITGSLPYKLEIVKIDTISPVLGKEFLNNIILLGFVVFIGVGLTIFLRYRKLKITIGVLVTMFAEAFITLAVAALIKWNLDATSLAGLIAGIGTGVNDQIVIVDEALSGGADSRSLKEKLKGAFFVILTAFFLIVAAMIPLFWAGAGLLKGFALTTILGVSIGVLITRPAFSEIVRHLVKDK